MKTKNPPEPQVNDMCYLGIFMLPCVSLRFSVDYAKCSLYCERKFFQGGCFSSEEVILQLVMQKCVPVLLHGLEVCARPNRTLQAFHFTMNRVFGELI